MDQLPTPVPAEQMPQGQMPEGAPVESGMQTPQPAAGDEAHADVSGHMAMEMLEHILPVYGSTTAKGAAILNAIKTLAKVFGESSGSKAKDLSQSEIMTLLQSLPQQGGAPQGAPTPGAAGPAPPIQ